MKRTQSSILWKTSWITSIPLFVLSLSMAVRSLYIQTNDLFHFGRGKQWWCYGIVNYWHVSASWEVYESGFPNGGLAGVPTGQWFFYHLKAGGGIWSVSGITLVETHHCDWGIAGYDTFDFRGKPAQTTYWFNLGPILPICTMLSGGTLAWQFYRAKRIRNLARMNLCRHCSYDLRAHRPGDKCPECGAPILAKN